ncbi:MAG: ATP-dependent helicase [Pseudomonadota bacterium]
MPQYVIRTSRSTRRSLNLDQDLNEQQREVVLCGGGPILVLAGAGSGKTRTLTYRAAHLVEQGVDPKHLLLCTFTNRAARDMLLRVSELIACDLRSLWAGTFHHVANLALRRYSGVVGLQENYAILDREDARDLMASALAQEGKKLVQRKFPSAAILQHLASMAVNTQCSLLETINSFAPRFLHVAEDIDLIVDKYTTQKRRLGLLDFDDLLLFFRTLLTEHPRPAAELMERFLHVLVDEYQDTNRLQGEIVELCASTHGNLAVVGDDAQSIYAFRGAHFKNIIEFPKRFPNAQVFKLETNYRSTPEILQLANASISHNTKQFPKILRPVHPSGPIPAMLPLHDAVQQANFVAQRILELNQEGANIPLSEIAVLYRAHSHSLELQVELTKRKIPFFVRSGLRFFEQAHIKDVLAYLRVTHNVGDTLALKRILRLWPGIGPRTVDQIQAALQKNDNATISSTSLAKEILDKLLKELPKSAQISIRQLGKLLEQLDKSTPPSEKIKNILDVHYREYAQSVFPNADTRLEDLSQLADFSQRYESLEQFLSELALVAGVVAEGIGSGEVEEEKLALSTVHQAKGLEWRAVFVLALSEGQFPSALAVQTDEEVEEERRLFYVAVTRAKDLLYLCYPRFKDTSNGPRRLLRISRFLAELEKDTSPFERWEIQEVAEEE